MDKKVLVIGGGAAGMAAAIVAARKGAKVTILERNARVGKKILATGNGRCNFTNIDIGIEAYSGKNPKFAYGALSEFGVYEALNFFEELGIVYKVEDLGKVYPMSDQASSILDVLMNELECLGVETVCDTQVIGIHRDGKGFLLSTDKGNEYRAGSVILATGGKAMPASGSDGIGYQLAEMLGHSVEEVFPALVQLMLEGPYFKRLSGVKFIGTAEVIYQNKSLAVDSGEILFTNYGISGPPILQLSRAAAEKVREGKEVFLEIKIIDQVSQAELAEMIAERLSKAGSKSLDFSFVGWINKRLIPVVLAEAGIKDVRMPAVEVSAAECEKIAQVLSGWRFKVRGTRSWPSAQVTAGGVATEEINQKTMESKLVPGLFFAGEVMDIDGKCGGFNLQWAWSSGHAAGVSAAGKL